MEKVRCQWSLGTENLKHYHDTEWGVPLHDDKILFEFLVLDAFQAGLSWSTILNKRENFRSAFDGFDAEIIINYNQSKIDELMQNAGIIRNKLKIESTISNARAFLEIKSKLGSFDKFIWQFTDGKTIVNSFKSLKEIPASTALSDKMSKELKKNGFRFVGTTICYAFMQAIGMVNDHTIDCFRYKELTQL